MPVPAETLPDHSAQAEVAQAVEQYEAADSRLCMVVEKTYPVGRDVLVRGDNGTAGGTVRCHVEVPKHNGLVVELSRADFARIEPLGMPLENLSTAVSVAVDVTWDRIVGPLVPAPSLDGTLAWPWKERSDDCARKECERQTD